MVVVRISRLSTPYHAQRVALFLRGMIMFAKKWDELGAWAIFPGSITYKPKINSSTLLGESTRAGARQESGTANGKADIVGELEGVSGRTVNREAVLDRYGLMPQDIPANCDGCGKRFLIEHSLSCPKGGLVLAHHDDTAKEWGALGAWDFFPSAITYKPKINSKTVQGERTWAGAQKEGGVTDSGTDNVGATQGGRARG